VITPTQAQIRIRDHEDLDLLIVAPAGCGKTEALAMRIDGMLRRGVAARGQRLLVTTFSNRARDNVRERLAQYVPAAIVGDRISVANFHGLAARIYRAHANVIELDASVPIPENDWVGDQCRSRRLQYKVSGVVQDLLRMTKQDALTDSQVEERLRASGNQIALEIEQQRVAERRLTYDDLPRLAELILRNDEVAALYCHHFAAVVVDEFQDLTPQQLRIVNSIALGRTTYAGDLAQGIYSFAGAKPAEIHHRIKAECRTEIKFSDSHRSSPAVLGMLNALSEHTGGVRLQAADPDSWPGGGLAGGLGYATAADEAQAIVRFCRYLLSNAPTQRIGVLARTGGKARRRFVDAAMSESDLPHHRWDDGVLDTDTAKITKAVLSRLDLRDFHDAADPLVYLRELADLEAVQDPSTRDALASALNWCCDLLHQGEEPTTIHLRIRVGDAATLLSIPGVHLLTGHIGKGQQFDWVVILGAEDGCIPDFRAQDDPDLLAEEARIFSVMISRARHGCIVSYAGEVPAASGVPYRKEPSRYWEPLAGSFLTADGINHWFASAAWALIAAR